MPFYRFLSPVHHHISGLLFDRLAALIIKLQKTAFGGCPT
jgi:hypothetical protein